MKAIRIVSSPAGGTRQVAEIITSQIEIIPEKIISQDISLSNTVEMIIRDIFT